MKAGNIAPLMDFIAHYESRGNYNAFYGAVANIDDPALTSMSIDEVLAWQEGRRFSASGKYQIIRKTLLGLKEQLGLGGAELFDEAMQDRLGRHLLERRGLNEFLSGAMSRDEFACSVAHEWAALPGVLEPHGAQSVYESDGVNRALVAVEDYLAAIESITV